MGKDLYLKSNGTILQSCLLLSPVEEVVVIDDTGPKVRVVEEAGVIETKVVFLWPDKPVTETGLSGSLTRHSRETGRCQTTHRNPHNWKILCCHT